MHKIKNLFHGAICFVEREGYVIPRRFTFEQTDTFSENPFTYQRVVSSASVTMSLTTTATFISFGYRLFTQTNWQSTFEVYTNGFLTHLTEEKELEAEGVLTFELEEGRKNIEIYLPNGSEVGIKDFYVNNTYDIIPQKRTKVLFIGDSITQGFGAKRSSQTYVNIVKRTMNYEILNQGIGGYYCDEKLVKELPYTPDKIIVAFGTNHRDFSEEKNQSAIGGFFKALNERYEEKKILVVLAPFYGREQTEAVRNKYKRIKEIFVDVVSKYANIQIVSAYEMIPHFAEYYMDDFVHPNALGMEIYGSYLVKAIKRIKF